MVTPRAIRITHIEKDITDVFCDMFYEVLAEQTVVLRNSFPELYSRVDEIKANRPSDWAGQSAQPLPDFDNLPKHLRRALNLEGKEEKERRLELNREYQRRKKHERDTVSGKVNEENSRLDPGVSNSKK